MAKGYDYSPLDIFTSGDDPNHTWNVVHVSGDWRIVECSWGAGHLDHKKKFCFSYKEFYFLPDPPDVLWTHFPLIDNDDFNSRPWQLVNEPVGLMKFNKTFKPLFRVFEWEVKFSNTHAVHDVWRKINLTMEGSDVTPLGIVTCQLFHVESGREVRQFSIVQNLGDGKFQITVRPPIKGKFYLKVLANTDSQDDETLVLVQYFLRCHEAMPDLQPYPDHFGFWGTTNECFNLGVSKEAEISPILLSEGDLELTIPTTKHLEATIRLSFAWGNIQDIDNYNMIESTMEAVHFRARFPRQGFYKMKLMIKNDKGDYKCAVNYLVECHAPASLHATLPKVYKTARELQCRLLEPVCLNLMKKTPVTIKFTSPDLGGASVNGDKFEKVNNNEWEVSVTAPGVGQKFMVSGGGSEETAKYKGLYEFRII